MIPCCQLESWTTNRSDPIPRNVFALTKLSSRISPQLVLCLHALTFLLGLRISYHPSHLPLRSRIHGDDLRFTFQVNEKEKRCFFFFKPDYRGNHIEMMSI